MNSNIRKFSVSSAFSGCISDFRFVILIAGFKSLVSSHAVYYDHILQIPSLHVIGDTDTVIVKGKLECTDTLSYQNYMFILYSF